MSSLPFSCRKNLEYTAPGRGPNRRESICSMLHGVSHESLEITCTHYAIELPSPVSASPAPARGWARDSLFVGIWHGHRTASSKGSALSISIWQLIHKIAYYNWLDLDSFQSTQFFRTGILILVLWFEISFLYSGSTAIYTYLAVPDLSLYCLSTLLVLLQSFSGPAQLFRSSFIQRRTWMRVLGAGARQELDIQSPRNYSQRNPLVVDKAFVFTGQVILNKETGQCTLPSQRSKSLLHCHCG